MRATPGLLGLAIGLLGASASRAEPRVERLKVPGFRDAALIAPRLPGKRPVVVGLHGNFDRPEWFCGEGLAPITNGKAWLLCPRGVPRGDAPRAWDRWTWPARSRVRAEIDAALAALRRERGERIAEAPPLLAGFSLGAILAARLAVERPERAPFLYLVEGSHQVWDARAIARFTGSGGRAILFGCGGRGCAAITGRICASVTRGSKTTCATVTATGLGHGYGSPLTALSAPRFHELLGPALAPPR